MGEQMEFDYYYGIEAEQFSFYRVPRLLIKDERFRGLSSDAKLLYGLMLDRMALSRKNGWFDEENRAYVIYTIDNIREDLGCSKEKAIKVLAELDSAKGIGLVEKVRRGLGKPDVIYVKNFAVPEAGKEPSKADISTEVGKTDFKRSEKPTSGGREIELQEVGKSNFKRSEKPTSGGREIELQEVGKSNFKRSEKPTSGGREIELQEVGKADPNYTDFNQTDINQTEENHINPIYQADSRSGRDMMDTMDETAAYMDFIRENIEYDHHMKYAQGRDKELYEELYDVICDVVCVKRQSVRVGGEDYPYELVKSRFLKLNSSHLEYVIGCMKETTSKIGNIKAYMVTALYNAPSTMNHYYQQEVNHDMFGGGWEEKGVIGSHEGGST